MGSTSCSKRCMIVFEILCALIALVLIAFGIYVLCSYETNEVATLATYAYIGVGVATLVIMFFGCLGALRESVCCTVTFIVLLVIIVIAQVAVVFLLTKGQQSVASNLANTLDAAWENELTTPGAMTQYENWFDCCGRASPQDYVVNGVLPPASCYKNHDNSLPANLITKGCRVEFENYWMHLLLVFNILGWVLIGVQVVGSIVSCMHCNSIRNDRRRSYF